METKEKLTLNVIAAGTQTNNLIKNLQIDGYKYLSSDYLINPIAGYNIIAEHITKDNDRLYWYMSPTTAMTYTKNRKAKVKFWEV